MRARRVNEHWQRRYATRLLDSMQHDAVSLLSPQLVLLVRAPLARAGEAALDGLRQRFSVHEAGSTDAALNALREHSPRLVLLADDLPDARALTLLRGFTPLWHGPYVCLVGDRDDVAEQIVALEAGFDDVWTSAMDPRLAVARARALIRRPVRTDDPWPDAVAAFGLVLDRTRRLLSYEQNETLLSPREVEVLGALVQRRGQVVERSDLNSPEAAPVSPSAVDFVVFRLRQRLSDVRASHVVIASVRGHGYALRRKKTLGEGDTPRETF